MALDLNQYGIFEPEQVPDEKERAALFPTPKAFIQEYENSGVTDLGALGKTYAAAYKKYARQIGMPELNATANANIIESQLFEGISDPQAFYANYDSLTGIQPPETPVQAKEQEQAGIPGSLLHGAGGAVGGSISGISDAGHALGANFGTLVRFRDDILPSYVSPEETRFLQQNFPQLMGIGSDPIYQAGKGIKNITATENPSTIPAAIGSALGTLGTVAVGGMAGLGAKGATALGMLQSANQLANEGADDYRETLEKQGKPLDADQLANTTLFNSALSLADAFPGGRLAKSMGLTALDDATGGFIKKAVLGAASEGATEVAQTLAQNWIANGIVKYDPDRDTWEGADEALVGGAGAGAFMNSLVHLIGGRRVSGTGGESGINETQTAPETRSTTTTAQSVNPLDSFVEQEAGEAVTQVSRELAGTERQAAAQPQASGLSALISSGEGGYGSYNRGKAGDANGAEIDFSQMTVAELMQAQALPEGDQNRIFAFGKYQIIPSTLQEAVRALRIDPNTSVTPELQERIFSGFLLKGKRPDIEGYITGRHDDLTRAQKAGSQEWASIANPETGRSYYDGTGNNSASISADQFGAGLQAARAAYRQAIESGAEPEQAWQQAIGTPAPAANGQTAAGQPPSDVQTGNGEITIRINSGYQQTARQQPEPTPDNYIEPPGTSAIFPEPVTAGPQDTVPAADNTPEQQQIQLPDGTTTTTTTGQPDTAAIRQADIYDAENNRYQAEYDIIDAATLTPTIDKADNQYRDRTRTALQAQVDSIAANPVYGRLNTQHSTFTDGAPVLANGDTLIAGNGRMAGLKQAYEQGTADNYRQQLTQDAGRLGFDTEAISRMQQPVLVRRMQGDVNTSKLAVLSNIGTGAAMSDLEQAKVDAGYIRHLGDFNPADDAEINFQSAPGLFQRLRSAAPEGERNNIMTADGKVSADGARRVKNALMYMAYGDSPVLADMVESQDPDHINITKALVQAAPRLAEMRDSIRQGIIYDADITPDIVQSFSLFKQIRRDQGNTIDSWISQQDAFSQTPETVKTLIRRLDEGAKKPGQLRDFLNAYADKLKTYGNPNQQGMFGGNPVPTNIEVLQRAERDTYQPPAPPIAGTTTASAGRPGPAGTGNPDPAGAKAGAEPRAAETGAGGAGRSGTVGPRFNISPRIDSDIDWLDRGDPVTAMKGDEIPVFDKRTDLARWVGNYWNEKYGGKVTNPDLGEVFISKQSARNSIAHGSTRAKEQAFLLIPEGLKQGRLLGQLPQSDGKLQAHIVGAPVRIGDNDYKLLMLIRQDMNGKRLYVHEAILMDKNDSTEAFITSAASLDGAEPQRANRGAIYDFMRQLREKQGTNFSLQPTTLDQTITQTAQRAGLDQISEDALTEVFSSRPKNDKITTRLLRDYFAANHTPTDQHPDSRSFVTARMAELRNSGALQAVTDAYNAGQTLSLSDSNPRTPISRERAESTIRRIIGDRVPVETTIPDHIRAMAGDATDRVKGAYYQGTIYIDADNMGSAAEAEAVAVEELTHAGVINLLGNEYDTRLRDLYEAIGGEAGIRRFLKKHNIAMAEDYFSQPATTQMDELLAHLEANKGTLTVRVKRALQKVFGHIREQLRRLDARILPKLSDSDLVLLAGRARKTAGQEQAAPMQVDTARTDAAISPDIRYHLAPKESSRRHEMADIAAMSGKRINRARNLQRYLNSDTAQTWQDRYAATKRAIYGDKDQWAEIKKWTARHLGANSTLGRNVADARRGIDWARAAVHDQITSDIVALEFVVQNIYKKHRADLTRAEQDEFHQVLTGQLRYGSEELQAQVDVFRAKIDRASTDLISSKYDEMQMRINELTDEGRAALGKIAGRLKAGDKDVPVPPQLVHIANLQRQINTITGNLGKYVTRSYQAFSDPKWIDKVRKKPVYEDAVRYLAEQDNLTDSEARGTLNEWLESTRGHDSMVTFSVLQGTNEGIMKRRKDIPPVLREVLGEYTDPVYNYANSLVQTGEYVARQRYQLQLRKLLEAMPGIAHIGKRPEAERFVQFPDSPAYSALRDLWIDRDFMADLEEFGSLKPIMDNTLYRGLVSTSAAVKLGKTVAAPTTQMRNFWSGFLLLAATGHSPLGNFTDAFNTMKNARNRVGTWSGELKLNSEQAAELNQKYVRLGVRRDGSSSGELERIFRDFHNMSNEIKERGLLKKGWSVLLRSYQFSDDFFKIMAFEKEAADLQQTGGLSRADAEQEAARRIRDTMPTYSMLPQAVQQLRQFPLMGPFVAFPFEMFRTAENNVRYMMQDWQRGKTNPAYRKMATKRALGMFTAYALPSIASLLSMALAGIEDEDDEALDHFGSDWRKGQLRLYLGNGETGARYVDLTSLVPSEFVVRAVREGWQEGSRADDVASGIWSGLSQALLNAGQPFYSMDIATKGFAEIAANNNSYGRPIYGEGKTLADLIKHPAENAQHIDELTGYIASQFGPGVVQNFKDFGRALAGTVGTDGGLDVINEYAAGIGGNVSRSGKQATGWDAALALAGFRVTTQDMSTLGLSASGQTRNKIASYSSEFKQALDTTVNLSPDFIDGQLEQLLADRKRAYDKMSDLIKYYRNKKWTDAQIQAALYERNRTLGKNAVAELLRGKTPIYEPSKELLSRSLSAVDRIQDPAVRFRAKQALAGRYRYVVQRANELQNEQAP